MYTLNSIGTTPIANGGYRLHPIEWSIGEAVGGMAAEALGVSRHVEAEDSARGDS